ncbi:MAG: serine/threonine protein kinase [Deltaproteobacteria bacterium]|nr:serine/threonine protein kinase [Deltaproteobacteria bacterium]
MLEGSALVGSEVAGRYRVVRLLGEGGSSWVYEVEHLRTSRRHALKVLRRELAVRPRSVERFRREARTAAELGSRNIVGALDVGALDDGRPFILLELLAGETLRERLRRDGRLPLAEAVDIGLQCCSALGAAHARGVVHRDLKPDNLHLAKDPTGGLVVKILDFGISKLTEEARDLASGSLTRTGVAIGTPYYMSPEQLDASHELDRRADVYALGVVLFEMLTGKRPFEAPALTSLVLKIAAEPPPRPSASRPEVGDALDAIVVRALAKRPADRFSDMGAMADALRKASPDPSARNVRRTWVREVAGLIVLVLGVPLTLWAVRTPALPAVEPSAPRAPSVADPRSPRDREAAVGAPVPASQPGLRSLDAPPRGTHGIGPSSEPAAGPSRPAAAASAPGPGARPGMRTQTSKTQSRRTLDRERAVPSTAAATTPGDLEPARPTARVVTVRNTHRTSVEVRVRCGSETIVERVAASASGSLRLPPTLCHVSCAGVGEPACASLLPASTTVLVVR